MFAGKVQMRLVAMASVSLKQCQQRHI